jgi:hypothetical protein
VKTKFARRCLACLGTALMLLSNAALSQSTPPTSQYRPGGYEIAFFNGVFNTELDAFDGLFALADIDLSSAFQQEDVKYELFYNQTGMDRPGMPRFEDMIEAFRQRMADQDPALANRWETFWEVLHGETRTESITTTIYLRLPSSFPIFDALSTDVRTRQVDALADQIAHPPAIADYPAQKTALDARIAQKEKIILVAHSQGNLFSTAAYDYALGRVAPGSIRSVHIAPPSPALRGEYTSLAQDSVLNALRLRAPVPESNTSFPNLPLDASGHELVTTYLSPQMTPYWLIASQLERAVLLAGFSP